MRFVSAKIRNFRSITSRGVSIYFSDKPLVLLGANNSGKTNICRALSILLGETHPLYSRLSHTQFNDPTKPIEISVIAQFEPDSEDGPGDNSYLYSIPHLTKKAKGACYGKLTKGQTAEIELSVILWPVDKPNDESEDGADIKDDEDIEDEESASSDSEKKNELTLKFGGVSVFRKVNEIRKAVLSCVYIPALRYASDQLTASKWTSFGSLMKAVLEDHNDYVKVERQLKEINRTIQGIFDSQRKSIKKGSSLVDFVDDLQFQLTKEEKPSELLRNLEVLVKDQNEWRPITESGSGTQSVAIISVLEMVLHRKSAKARLLLVEEPEALLYPTGVRKATSLLNATETQALFTTHSPVLVASSSPNQLCRVFRNKEGTQVEFASPDSIPTPTEWTREDRSNLAEALFHRSVILVEGAFEKYLFPSIAEKADVKRTDGVQVAELRNSCSLFRRDISVLNVDGIPNFVKYMRLLNTFGVPWVALSDMDLLGNADVKESISNQLGVELTLADEEFIDECSKMGFYINPDGESEDSIPKEIVASLSTRDIAQVQQEFEDAIGDDGYPRGSKAMTRLLNADKVGCALAIAKYYDANDQVTVPFNMLFVEAARKAWRASHNTDDDVGTTN